MPGGDSSINTSESSVVRIPAGERSSQKSRILFWYGCGVVEESDPTTYEIHGHILEGIVRATKGVSNKPTNFIVVAAISNSQTDLYRLIEVKHVH
jgi:hypothetical protein